MGWMPLRPSLSRRGGLGWVAAAVVPAVLVLTPVVAVIGGALRPDTAMWRHQWQTRLPGEIWSSVVLVTSVVVVSSILGVGLAWLVSAHEFPGRRFFGWALVAPLALPAYILGFVATAVLGVAGPLQTWWRDTFGADAWFPEVRSMGTAVAVFALTLYPYVYLLARAALRDQAGDAYGVARTLGASRGEALRRVVLPMLRPAVAAGAAIVAMETLTDFATVQYFQVDTVTVGVFRVWRGTYDRDAAAELATLVLGLALVAIVLERALRGRARFAQSGGEAAGFPRTRLTGARAALAVAACSSVLALAFVAPVARLASWAWVEQQGPRGTPLTDRYLEFLRHSAVLSAVTVGIVVVVAVLVTNAHRFSPGRVTGLSRRSLTVGYAVPGPVVAMGIVLTLVAVDGALDGVGLRLPGTVATGSFLALLFAYGVRFAEPAVASTESGLNQVPDDLTASARSLGARPITVAARVHLPLSRASLLAAATLVAVDALKELPVVLLLRPIGFDTLSVWVFNLASESRFEQAALPALTIVVVALVPLVILTRGLDRGRS